MNPLEIAAILTAVVALLTAIGRGVAYLITLLVDQFRATIDAKDDEIDELRKQLADCQRRLPGGAT